MSTYRSKGIPPLGMFALLLGFVVCAILALYAVTGKP